MRILMILPYDRTYFYRGFFTRFIRYAPLTFTVLAALIPEEIEAQVTIVDEGVQKPKSLINEAFDIVAITACTSAVPRAYFLCDYWKKRGAYVVLGGAHASFMPDEAMQHADTVFSGLAEHTWPQFLYDFQAGQPLKIYRHHTSGEHLPMPIPRRDLLARSSYQKTPTIIANRGCANKCSFCSISQLWGAQGLTRPIAEVVNEIKSVGASKWIFLDPSPYSNKKYFNELLHALVPLKISWAGLSTLDIADDKEMLELMLRSGCKSILLGFETINQNNLTKYDKLTNIALNYKRQIDALHAHNISILGCFVLGFDEDTESGIEQLIKTIDELGIDFPRYALLTPFPGTALYADMDAAGRIIAKDYSLYDTEHVVFQPKNFSGEKLRTLHKRAWRTSYTWKAIFKRMLKMKGLFLTRLMVNIGFKIYARKLINESGEFDAKLYYPRSYFPLTDSAQLHKPGKP
jgi:radical SAM superfamily enzyme YgiQ (UPF0313 family)